MPAKKKRPANEFFDAVSAMADELGFDDQDDRGKYIHQHMVQAGYRMVPSYVDDDTSDGKNDDDSFFPSRGNSGRGNQRGNEGGGSRGGWFPA